MKANQLDQAFRDHLCYQGCCYHWILENRNRFPRILYLLNGLVARVRVVQIPDFAIYFDELALVAEFDRLLPTFPCNSGFHVFQVPLRVVAVEPFFWLSQNFYRMSRHEYMMTRLFRRPPAL